MRKTHVSRALQTLDGVIEIAKHEQLLAGRYVFAEINEELKDSGAICGGRKACLIGSLYLSYGVDPEPVNRWEEMWFIPGIETEERISYMRNRPALRLAYESLNDAAERFLKRNMTTEEFQELQEYTPNEGYAEHMFETFLWEIDYNDIRDTVIKIARAAKSSIRRRYKDLLEENKSVAPTLVAA